jgi:transposase
MARGDLTDSEWERLQPLLPPEHSGKQGHPYEDHRRVINGILWVLRTGAPWRDIPERYGSWHTCHDRLLRWQREGLWERVLQQLQGRADAAGAIDWEVSFADSSITRAHQHAAGARRRRAKADEKGARHRFLVRRSARAEAG